MKYNLNSRLLKNMGFLYILNIANYAIPLITIPYLVRTIGLEKFGLIAFAYALNFYLVALTNYGFHLTATQEIAVNRENRDRVSEIYFNVMTIKCSLLFLSLIMLILTIFSFHRFRIHWQVYLITFTAVMGNVLFPRWLFQGLEQMKYITLLAVSGRIISLCPIFFLVNKESDYILAALFQSGGELVAGFAAVYIIFKNRIIRFAKPSIKASKALVTGGWHVFVSQMAVTGFTNSNLFILGLFAPPQAVGAFSLAEKLVRAAVGLVGPVSEAVYPKASSMFADSRTNALAFLRSVLIRAGSVFLLSSIVLFAGADLIVLLISGERIAEAALLLRIMAPVPFLVLADNIYGTQVMLNINMKKEFMNVIIISGIFSVILSFSLVPVYYARASAWIFLLSQFLVLLMMMAYLGRTGINPLLEYAEN